MENEMKALYETVVSRKTHAEEGSYTAYLYEKGLEKILKKVGEECTEVIIAAMKEDSHDEVVNEIGDLIYHLFVMMAEKGITLDEVNEELSRRAQKTGKPGSVTDVDWENELKNAKYLDQKVRVWQRYYREEWGEDANVVFKIDGAFMQECMAYGFDERTNPFISYLRRVLDNPSVNKSKVPGVYPAVHNAFVRRYLLIGDIRGGSGDTGGVVPYASCNIINSSGLYDLSPSEAFEELRLQQIAVEKFKKAVNDANDRIGVSLRRAYKYDQNPSNAISMFVAAVFGDDLNPSKPTFSGIMGKKLTKLRSPRGVRNILAIYFDEIPDTQLVRSKTQLTAENLDKLIGAIRRQEPSATKLSVALAIADRLYTVVNDGQLSRKISWEIPEYNDRRLQPSDVKTAARKAMEGYRFDNFGDTSRAVEALAKIVEQELKKGQGEA